MHTTLPIADPSPNPSPSCGGGSPCESCHAGCCRSFAVPVTGADVLRIERDLSVPFWTAACRWADPDGTIARRHAPHLRFRDEPETPFVLCLTHEPSRFLPGSTKCRFLTEGQPDAANPLGQARCGIYATRPMACRAFPTKLHRGGELAVLYDVPARGRDGDHPAYDLCPRPWRPEDVDAIDAPRDLAAAKYEMDFFRSVAAVWNRTPRPAEIFPDFLRVVYGGRVVREETRPATVPLPGVTRAAA